MPSPCPEHHPGAGRRGARAAAVLLVLGLAGACAEAPVNGAPTPPRRAAAPTIPEVPPSPSLPPTPAEPAILRVCADPNNLPFSNQRGEGFENRIAELLARDLGAELEYTWWAQRRGFLRHTLNAGRCDLVTGMPSSTDRALVTAPYYRSTYVFVSPPGQPAAVRSFDDPALRRLRVGVQMIGDDYTNSPPAHALANRGIVDNVRGYAVYGDYREDSPPARILEAVARHEVDVAVVWGPLAGYHARRHDPPLVLVPVEPQIDLPFLPFVFDISLAVRRGDEALRDRLDLALERRRGEIDAVLAEYGVPRLDRRDAPAPAEPARPDPSRGGSSR